MRIVDGVWVDGFDAGEKNLVFPKEMEHIGDTVFEDLFDHGEIESITVEEGNEHYKAVGNCLIEIKRKRLILGCSNSVIPNDGSVEVISALAFCGCKELKRIDLPDTLTEICHGAFADTGLREIILPRNLKYIGGLAFSGTDIESVYIPSSVIGIGGGAFCGCASLTRIDTDPYNRYFFAVNNCLISNNRTLLACTNGTSIPEGIKRVDELAFYRYSSNLPVVFPNSVKRIKRHKLKMPTMLEFPITIVAPNGSYALRFAKKNGIPHEAKPVEEIDEK